MIPSCITCFLWYIPESWGLLQDGWQLLHYRVSDATEFLQVVPSLSPHDNSETTHIILDHLVFNDLLRNTVPTSTEVSYRENLGLPATFSNGRMIWVTCQVQVWSEKYYNTIPSFNECTSKNTMLTMGMEGGSMVPHNCLTSMPKLEYTQEPICFICSTTKKVDHVDATPLVNPLVVVYCWSESSQGWCMTMSIGPPLDLVLRLHGRTPKTSSNSSPCPLALYTTDCDRDWTCWMLSHLLPHWQVRALHYPSTLIFQITGGTLC